MRIHASRSPRARRQKIVQQPRSRKSKRNVLFPLFRAQGLHAELPLPLQLLCRFQPTKKRDPIRTNVSKEAATRSFVRERTTETDARARQSNCLSMFLARILLYIKANSTAYTSAMRTDHWILWPTCGKWVVPLCHKPSNVMNGWSADMCVCLMLSNRMDSICGRANGQVMEYRIMAPIWYRFFVPKSTIWRAIFFEAK